MKRLSEEINILDNQEIEDWIKKNCPTTRKFIGWFRPLTPEVLRAIIDLMEEGNQISLTYFPGCMIGSNFIYPRWIRIQYVNDLYKVIRDANQKGPTASEDLTALDLMRYYYDLLGVAYLYAEGELSIGRFIKESNKNSNV